MQILFGLYFGSWVVMALYLSVVFVAVRDSTYIYCVAYICLQSLYHAAYHGLAFEYLWPNFIWWANQCVPIIIAVSFLPVGQFTRKLLNTRETSPGFDRFLRGVLWASTIPIVTSVVLKYRLAIRLSAGTEGGFEPSPVPDPAAEGDPAVGMTFEDDHPVAGIVDGVGPDGRDWRLTRRRSGIVDQIGVAPGAVASGVFVVVRTATDSSFSGGG